MNMAISRGKMSESPSIVLRMINTIIAMANGSACLVVNAIVEPDFFVVDVEILWKSHLLSDCRLVSPFKCKDVHN